MSDDVIAQSNAEPRGWRAVPPALLIAFAVWIGFLLVRLVWLSSHEVSELWAPRWRLVGEGVSLACSVLGIFGTFDLARRLTGREALGLKIAGWGSVAGLISDLAFGLVVGFVEKIWDHRWVFEAWGYVWFATMLIIAVGFAVAAWQANRGLAIAGVVVAFVAHPPEFLQQPLFGWLELGNKTSYMFQSSLSGARLVFLLLLVVAVARGVGPANREAVASGLRSAARALWIRVIAAVSVALITLMVIGSKGGKGSVEVVRLAMITAAVVNVIALMQFGLGALRAARAEVSEVPRYPMAIAGGISLWATGVMFAQLPYLYRILYKKSGEGLFGSSELTEYTQMLAIAMPLLVIAAIALVAISIGGLAAKRGSDNLRAQAQGSGIGFVALMLISMAIQTWMLPKAESMSSFAMMSLFVAGLSLVATVMMAKLCSQAADEIEREPGLPTASVISGGT